MNKVICEICGTVYPETSDSCPICGCSRDFFLEDLEKDILEEDFDILTSDRGRAGHYGAAPARQKKAIFDYDEVNADDEEDEDDEDPMEDPYDDDDDYEEESSANTGVVVVLVIIIVLLLLATGFLFFKFFLPNLMDQDNAEPTRATVATEQTEAPTVATEVSVPCTGIAVTGKGTLVKEGYQGILHVTVSPADTTDPVFFTSGDTSVVTVSEEGTITAVGEGKTTVLIVCGKQSYSFPVTVDYSAEAQESEDTEVPGLEASEPVTEAAEAAAAAEETTPEATEETQPATEAPTEAATEAPDVILKLKDRDISFNRWGLTYDLRLDCDLEPEDVSWMTMNSSVVVVNNGTITVVGSGTTRIIATYGDQTAECIVRCNFS